MKKTIVSVLAVAIVLAVVNIAMAGEKMGGIIKKGELIVGVTGTQPPLNVTDKNGNIIGFDADLAKLIAANMGVKIKFEPMPFPHLLPALKAARSNPSQELKAGC